jgi:hypothetical protein
MSLKVALVKLLDAPCYHMAEVFRHPEHVSDWHSAALGRMPDWHAVLDGYAAAVDWPASAFWPELSEAFPDALILHSVRDPEAWWRSATETIFSDIDGTVSSEWRAMIEDLFSARFSGNITNREACIAAFESHNAHVRATAPPARLLEWHASQGWEPICSALGLPVPEEPFPRVNTREEWAARRSAQRTAADPGS